jgi:hypothetical protein
MNLLPFPRPILLSLPITLFLTLISLPVLAQSQFARGTGPILAGAAAKEITPIDARGRLWQEPYTDDNGNGRYDAPNPLNPSAQADHFTDTNHNGKWDGPFLAGFRHKRDYYTATGVHDPLWTRVLVLQAGKLKMAWVALDVVGFAYPDVRKIRKAAAGLGFSRIIIASTHTHEGVDTMGLWGPNPFTDGKDPRMMDFIQNQTVAALREAERQLQPARITLAKTTLPDSFGRILKDRRDPIVLDTHLTAMKIEDLKGGTIATVVNASIHPETMGGKGSLITSDFPHYLREGIEKGGFRIQGKTVKGLGGVAIYFNGAVGGLMTTLGAEVKDESGKVLPQRSWEKMQRIGELMAGAALEALREQKPAAIDTILVQSNTILLPIDNQYLRALTGKGVIRRESYTNGRPAKGPEVGQEIMTEVDLISLSHPGANSEHRSAETDTPLAQIVTLPGELFPEIALGGYLSDAKTCWAVTDRKKAMDGIGKERIAASKPGVAKEPVLMDHLKAPFVFLFGLANDELGYIVPANDFVFPTYNPGPVFGVDRCGSKDHYEETLSASSEMAPRVTRALLELIENQHPGMGGRGSVKGTGPAAP